MSVITYTDSHAEGILARLRHGLAAAYERMIATREAEAERYVNAYLAHLDDEALASVGRTRDEINRAPKAPCCI